MRLARNLMLLAIAAIAALAMTATTATAQVEVIDEDSGLHCSPGPIHCEVDAHSETSTVITAHLLTGPEVTTSVCNDEFEAEINEDGTGWIEHQHLSGPQCPNKPCEATTQESGDGHDWPIRLEEEFGILWLHVDFCLEPAGGGDERQCDIEIAVDEESPHHYVFTSDDLECDGTPPPPGVRSIEVDGQWEIEGTPIEVIHL